MDWKTLLEQRRVEIAPATKLELDAHRGVVASCLHDAAIPDLSADGRFKAAYDAVRTLTVLVVRASGYRIRTHGGAHHSTFLALRAVQEPDLIRYAAYFDSCREKRNDVSYAASTITEAEAEDLLDQALEFEGRVAAWFATRHPDLGPDPPPARSDDPRLDEF